MRLIARRTLQDFWEAGFPDGEQPLRAWFEEAHQAKWKTTVDIKARYPRASVIVSERVVFNIGGNEFRLVVKVWLVGPTIGIKFVGARAEYDDIDVTRF